MTFYLLPICVDSPDVDLDALLGDLCQMELSLNAQIDSCDTNSNSVPHFPSYHYTGNTNTAAVTQPPPVIHTVPATPPSHVPVPSFTPTTLASVGMATQDVVTMPTVDDSLPPPPPPPPTSTDIIDSQMPLPPPPATEIPDNQMLLPPPPPETLPQTTSVSSGGSIHRMAIPPPPSIITAPPSSQKTPPESLAIEVGGGISPGQENLPSFLSPRSPGGQQVPVSNTPARIMQ